MNGQIKGQFFSIIFLILAARDFARALETMQAGGTAADDQDNYQSLPLEDRLVHKVKSDLRYN